jgi:hypothetical protein
MESDIQEIGDYFNVFKNDIKLCISKTATLYNLDEKEIINIIMKKISSLHNCRKLIKLSGPSVFKFYDNINGKRILLLGEVHNIYRLCNRKDNIYEIHNWLYDLAENAPECLDLFVEDIYMSAKHKKNLKNIKAYGAPIPAVRDKFINYNSQKSRYHQVDIRQGEVSEDPFISMYYFFAKKNINKLESDELDIIISNFNKKNIISYILGIDTSEFNKDYYLEFLSAINKFLGANFIISNKNKFPFKIIDKELSKMNKSIDKHAFIQTLYKLYIKQTLIHALSTIFMDIYVLSRLFITFDKLKMSRGPRACQKYIEPKNVIIYGGRDHIDVYANFFERFFKIKPIINIVNSTKNQCITLPKSFDFFQI